ncbi:hypothetical protein Sinac_2545 [Singulisphaera acidiphila DSM 18658]|uniref:Uncharacterized protein n=1 Tax=Singulisphaera acidiphila (strain ATCC BAA-1392 / DSM 18658 / VKM B-2454 / MOB10) TaxID=886293 RepID=L0DC92_SINAD|nr:hypothetical protein Sinac_2545 [Singulisphaera acidiphila DSM 18658]
MSTEWLYHASGIRGYKDVLTSFQIDQAMLSIQQEPNDCYGATDSASRNQSSSHVEHGIRSLPTGIRARTMRGPFHKPNVGPDRTSPSDPEVSS